MQFDRRKAYKEMKWDLRGSALELYEDDFKKTNSAPLGLFPQRNISELQKIPFMKI